MKTEHTPTPWIESKAINGENDICADNGHGGYSGTFIGIVRNKADRQFIIKACNNHQQLVEALEAIKARLNGEWDHPALVKFGLLDTNSDYDILEIARKALEASE